MPEPIAKHSTSQSFELGIYSFAELTPEASSGRLISPAERLKQLIEVITLADQVGLDVFGLGEHHRADFVSSAPEVILAAIAAKTSYIRLSSAVTVLSSADPVRVFQNFATLDLISQGRAEMMAGRGSFIESFPLFGYDLNDYDSLFSEKLDLLLQLRKQEIVSWSGRHRPALDKAGIYPRPFQAQLPLWIAVGGTPASAQRAGQLGLPMALAIIGGLPERFEAFAQLHKQAAQQAGHDVQSLPLSLNLHGFIADTHEEASALFWPGYAHMMGKIGRERGWSGITREQYEASLTLRGANVVGSPEEVVEKILFHHQIFGHQRMMLMLGVGTIPHQEVMRAVELYGTKVAPVVRQEIARRPVLAAG